MPRRINKARGAKTNFVARTDPNMSAKDVIAAAGRRGIKLTEGYVYRIRSMLKERAERGKAGARTQARGRPRGAVRGRSQGGSEEQQLRAAIAEIGLRRAREIFDEVEALMRR